MKKIILEGIAVFCIGAFGLAAVAFLAILIFWGLFSFVVWDMDLFLDFFTGERRWSKILVFWRIWAVFWAIWSVSWVWMQANKKNGGTYGN